VARKQDGGALRQHTRKGVCATHQVATYCDADVASLHESRVAETAIVLRTVEVLWVPPGEPTTTNAKVL
jgi:hypothetical protein